MSDISDIGEEAIIMFEEEGGVGACGGRDAVAGNAALLRNG